MRVTHIVLREQIGTEFQVIIEIKGATGLKSQAERRHRGSLGQFSHTLDAAELPLGILCCHARTPPATTMVIVGLQVRVRWSMMVLLVLLVLLMLSVEICRCHDAVVRRSCSVCVTEAGHVPDGKQRTWRFGYGEC
jgi:hypothetical protein